MRDMFSKSQSTAAALARRLLTPVLMGTLLGGCLSSDVDNGGAVADPWEPFNRRVHAFNDTMDQYALRPVAQTYTRVVPQPVQTGVANIFDNAGYPIVFINQFLQGKPGLGLQDSGRFLINSTIGVAGLFDVASRVGLDAHQEDFGQTLARWRLRPGPYLVVPFWGPVTLRSGLGDIVDSQAYLPNYIDDTATRNGVMVMAAIDRRAGLLDSEELVSGDEYLFMRDAFIQNRQFLINDGEEQDDPFLE